MRVSRICLIALLLAGCEIEDDLQIHEDGSGTYRTKVLVEKFLGPGLARMRATAESEGFRVVDQGETFNRRFVVFRKDFRNIAALSNDQGNFELEIETRRWFWREYRLHATVAAVSDKAFERRFTITMPGQIKKTSAGEANGQRVTWFCANGGTIDVVAEAVVLPFNRIHGWLAVAVVVSLVFLTKRVRRSSGALAAAGRSVCTTCSGPLPLGASFCPSCGDLTRGG